MKHFASDAFTECMRFRAQGLHFTVIGRELLERFEADQFALLASRPQHHLGIAQAIERQNMAGFRWGSRTHLLEMEVEERLHVRTLEVIGMKDERQRRLLPFGKFRGRLFERKVQDA